MIEDVVKDSCVWYKKLDGNPNPHRLKCNYSCDGYNVKCINYVGRNNIDKLEDYK